MESPSLALIGAGYWGRNLARNFLGLGVLRTVCDGDARALEALGDTYAGVRRTRVFGDVLEDSDVRQVAVAAPPALHAQLAREALLAGKDVFVEKPLCLDLAEAAELVRLASEKNRILMVGHLLQYHPCVERLREMVTSGELGRLCYLTSNRLNLGKIRVEENALWSFAPHDISVILALGGNQLPEEVRCVGEAYLTTGVPDTTLTSLRFAGNMRAHVYVSWLNPFKEQKLTVVGSEGMAVFDDTQPWSGKLVVFRRYLRWADGQIPVPNKAQAEPVLIPEAEPLRAECEHFLARCRDRQTPRTDGMEGLRVLRVLQAAQSSLDRSGDRADPRVNLAPLMPGAKHGGVGPSGETVSGVLPYHAHPSAVVDLPADIGTGTRIWHFSHISSGSRIGRHCSFGQNCFVAPGVIVGDNVKVQNNVSIYTGTVIEDDVFLGPSCVLTNVSNPRAQVNRQSLYEETRIRRGATVGANATIVCGVTLGRYAFVAAGAVVTRDAPDYALLVGAPARQVGWMSRLGHRLGDPDGSGIYRCPEAGHRYREETPGVLRCLDLAEGDVLPSTLSKGRRAYRHFKGGGSQTSTTKAPLERDSHPDKR